MSHPRILLIAIFVAALVSGASDGYHHARSLTAAGPLNLAFAFAFSALTFAWYYFDAVQNAYRRSKVLDVAVIFLAPIALPVYFVMSRRGRPL